MDNKNKSYIFWGGLTVASAALLGAGYYLYNLFASEDEELPEEQKEKLDEIKNEVEEMNGELTMDMAIKILAETNKLAEEFHKKNKPDLENRRREAIDRPEEYAMICQETFEGKEIAYNEAMKKVLNSIDNRVTFEDIHNILGKVNPVELEKLAYKYEHPDFDGPYPEDSRIKEAYMYYGEHFQKEIREFQRIISSGQHDPSQDTMLFFQLLIHKTKVDDMLYIKFKLTEQQLRYLLHERNLLNDPVIKSLHDQITRIDEMFTG